MIHLTIHEAREEAEGNMGTEEQALGSQEEGTKGVVMKRRRDNAEFFIARKRRQNRRERDGMIERHN